MSKRNLYSISFILIISLIIFQPTSEGMKTSIIDTHISSSCTIFTAAIGDVVYFGNNEDYCLNKAYQWYVPSQNITTSYGNKEIYGAVFLGFDNNNDEDVDTWPQGGMNEYGLCYDANGLPELPLNLDQSKIFPYTPYALAQVLWESKDVEEVISWYQNHRFFSMGGQIHYADKTGDAVVVSTSSTGQWAFTRINSSFLVSTNFNLDYIENGCYPCSRYDTASQMLGEIITEEDLTVSECASILHAVHQEGTYGTKYSNIFDPVNLDLYFNSGKEFKTSEKINLKEKLTLDETYEQRDNFFGIAGTDGYVLVKTEQIRIQFRTWTAGVEGVILVVVACVLLTPAGIFAFRKLRKHKKRITA